MKNNLLTKALFAFAMLFATLAQAVQLNGNYTINPSLAASTTNFKDFASAITYMTSNSTRADGGTKNTSPYGVSGPVVFNVAAATYTVTATISVPNVTGSSATNTITFEGGEGNAATRIITGNRASNAIWVFNQCKYVKLRNITLINTYTSSCGVVVFYNNTTSGWSSTSAPLGSCNMIQNCIVSLPNLANTTISSSCIAISASSTGYSYSAQYSDSNIIDNNKTINGYYGIAAYGRQNASYNRGVQVTNNTVTNANYYGLYFYYHYNPYVIENNDITVTSVSSGSGMYVYYNLNSNTTQGHRLVGNKVQAPYGGIWYYYEGGNINAPGLVANNIIITGNYSTNYGFYNYNSTGYYNNFVHNTIICTGGTSGYGMYHYGDASNINVKNNIFAITSTAGSMYPVYFSSNPSGNVVNYNVYYNASNANLLYRGGAWNASNYQTATAGGDSSFNLLPNFVNTNFSSGNADGHLTDGCGAKGFFLTGISPTVDVDNENRSLTTPMVGADEAGGLTNDISVTSILAPVVPITLGLQNVVCTVKNIGTNVINNFEISYKQNNEPIVSQTWTGSLNPCEEVQITFTGPNQINLVSSNNVKVFSSGPNSNLDSKRTNDTMYTQLFAPLNGIYTIGGLNPDFTNFAQAATALASGIMGPVVFDVRPGTYSQQVIIPAVVGTSPTNTVSFVGQDKTTTTIISSQGSNAVLRLNGCKYVSFENMTITNTNSQGTAVAIVGSSGNNNGSCNTIKNCIINVPSNTSQSYGINVTGTASGWGQSANMIDSTTIDSNIINGGYYGISLYGYSTTGVGVFNFNNQIRGNTFNDGYQYGMMVYYQNGGSKILNNKVLMRKAGSISSQMGLYYYDYSYFGGHYGKAGKVQVEISGNTFDAAYYGMYMFYPHGTADKPMLITNNIVLPGFNRYSGGGYYGVYLYVYTVGAIVTDPTPSIIFYHNSISFNGNAGGYGMYFYSDGGQYTGKTDLKNNIFYSTTGIPLYLSSVPNAYSTDYLDYNIYYKPNGGNILYKNGIYYNPTNVVSTAGGGINSFYQVPPFVSGSDLHISNACTKGMNASAFVPVDIDGETRGSLPNIGADEYPGLTRDVSIESIVSPVFPIGTGPQVLKLRIRNNGSSTINSTNVSYSLNGGPVVTIPWVGTLEPCDTLTVTFDGANMIDIPDANNQFVAFTSNPNGSNDENMNNDTLRSAALAPPLRGDYTIAGSGGDFINLTTAVNAVNLRGIGGHVTFNVSPGTYVEPASVSISNVIGLSDTSRITIRSINNDPSTTIIQCSSSPVIRMNGVSYIDLNGIRFLQQTTAGSVMFLEGNVTDINIYNCHLVAPATTSTSYVLYQSGRAVNVNMTKNLFEGCYYGVYFQSANTTYAGKNANIVIDSNLFNKISIYNHYLLYIRDVKVRHNTYNFGNGATTYGYWYGPMYPDSAMDVGYNTINSTANGGYYYLYYVGYYGYGGYLPETRAKVHHNTLVYGQNSGYGYWYYWGYYGSRIDYYSNTISNKSASNYTYIYYPGYYGNGVNFYNNAFPMNSAYMAYTGYASGSGVKFYNNSLHSTTSYTFYYIYAASNSGEGLEFKNNVITNSGGGSALYLNGAINQNTRFDYNNLYTTGATLVNGTTTYSTMSNMKNAGYCKNCLSFDAGYTSLNFDLTPNATNSNSWSLNGQGMPNSIATEDINGNPRSTSIATGAIDLGAYEFTPTSIPPAATLTPAAPPAAGGYQNVLFGRDTIARINWAGGSVPTSATVRLYSGTNPLGIVYEGNYYMNAYWDIAVSPASSYNYSLELYHKGLWQGTNPEMANVIGAQYNGGWQYIFTTTVDNDNNKLVLTNLTNFGQFTGTDATTPFTPTLMVLSDKNKQNVLTDPLKVYPNPFSNELNVQIDLTAQGNVRMSLMDITGKTLTAKEQFMNQGINRTTIEGMNDLKPGIYFMSVEVNGQTFVQKLIKQ